jgi:serine/threonine-protein phosphatase 2A regulatory subunit B''
MLPHSPQPRGRHASQELRSNWFSLPHAEMMYIEYLDLDQDQNGMLCLAELSNFRGGGLTVELVQRVFQVRMPHSLTPVCRLPSANATAHCPDSQECHTYRNHETRVNEIDYKAYLDFVLAMTYRGCPESLAYFFRLLILRKAGRLSAFEVRSAVRSRDRRV